MRTLAAVVAPLLLALSHVGAATPAAASTNYLTPPTTRSSASSTGTTTWNLWKLTPTSSAQITSASVLMDSANATSYQVLVFEDSAGSVGTQVGTLTQASSGSATAQFTGAVNFCSGTTYWVGIRGSSASYLANPYTYTGAQSSTWTWTGGSSARAYTTNSGSSYSYNTVTGYSGLTLAGDAISGTCVSGDAGGGSPSSSSNSMGSSTPVLQQIGRPASGSCDALEPADVNWGGAESGGWSSSWAEWMNDETGGFVCTRTLTFSSRLQRWVAS